jgi:hypothetical protein
MALEEAMGGGAAGVDDALGYALVVEVRDLLAQYEVLQQHGPAGSCLQRILVVGDPHPLIRRQRLACRIDTHTVEGIDRRVQAFDGHAAGLVGSVRFGQRAGCRQTGRRVGRIALHRVQPVGEPVFVGLGGVLGHCCGKLLRLSQLLAARSGVACRRREVRRTAVGPGSRRWRVRRL